MTLLTRLTQHTLVKKTGRIEKYHIDCLWSDDDLSEAQAYLIRGADRGDVMEVELWMRNAVDSSDDVLIFRGGYPLTDNFWHRNQI
jgi:hypothetical protein